MLLKTKTYKSQQSIAEYCRNGEMRVIAGADSNRLPYYRRLVFNVVKDSVASAFPIAKKYVDESIWAKMVETFFANHKCQEAQVWRMPFEFYQYAQQEKYEKNYNIPYLNDLLLFEWLEVELYMMEDLKYPTFKNSTNWKNNLIAVNPEHKLIKLEYPVHKLIPKEAQTKKGDYFLLLFREKDSGKIQFVDLSVLYTFLIENIIQAEKTLEEIINDILYVFGINDHELLQNNINTFLDDLKSRKFILGTLN